MNKHTYNVVVNGNTIYRGSLTVARNRYNHAIIEDWNDDNNIALVRDDGYTIDSNADLIV